MVPLALLPLFDSVPRTVTFASPAPLTVALNCFLLTTFIVGSAPLASIGGLLPWHSAVTFSNWNALTFFSFFFFFNTWSVTREFASANTWPLCAIVFAAALLATINTVAITTPTSIRKRLIRPLSGFVGQKSLSRYS